MSSRGPYRRHSAQFKLQLCQDIRSGILGRRDAQKKYALSANLIQLWLTQFDRGELTGELSVQELEDFRITLHAGEPSRGRDPSGTTARR